MEMDVVQAVAQHAEEEMGREEFQQISAVVASCKMLALELEGQENDGGDAGDMEGTGTAAIDMEALVLAGYLHDISVTAHGYQGHHVKSAELAVEFLQELDVPEGCISRVEQAILAHTTRVPPEQRHRVPLEGQILYDATNLGHLSGTRWRCS